MDFAILGMKGAKVKFAVVEKSIWILEKSSKSPWHLLLKKDTNPDNDHKRFFVIVYVTGQLIFPVVFINFPDKLTLMGYFR